MIQDDRMRAAAEKLITKEIGITADIVSSARADDNEKIVVITTKGRGRGLAYSVYEVSFTVDGEFTGEGVWALVARTTSNEDDPEMLNYKNFSYNLNFTVEIGGLGE